jgi:hypothetical protein
MKSKTFDVAGDKTRVAVGDSLAGARRRKRGRIGWLLGLGAVSDAAGRIASSASGAAGRVSGLGKAVFSRDREGIAVQPDIDDPAERFREATRLNGQTEDGLRAIQDNTWRGFYLYATLLVVALVAGMASLRYEPIGGLAPLDVAFRFFLVPVLMAMALKWGYVNWIFRRRCLDGFAAYLASGQWLPARSPSRGR